MAITLQMINRQDRERSFFRDIKEGQSSINRTSVSWSDCGPRSYDANLTIHQDRCGSMSEEMVIDMRGSICHDIIGTIVSECSYELLDAIKAIVEMEIEERSGGGKNAKA